MFSYLSFLYHSTNHHGVHSPFVYGLVTRGLYSCIVLKNRFLFPIRGMSSKQIVLIEKLIRHLKIQTLLTDVKIENTNTQLVVFQWDKRSENEIKKYDAILITQSKPDDWELILSLLHNDSILIINNPHSEKNIELWKFMLNNLQTTALIDVYEQGYVFIRREQKKELFRIRV